ncbi:BQ2448_6020 [Microbotryum intermedium]|uniref:BQ2448_6020 protein n=1 Tax=Microbotryum intermedium TaxID=269621 RepID=A0A238F691_9BASI|nr:BQ2448_6020 [Microbotryum intermedium]
MSCSTSTQQLQECSICHTTIDGDVGAFEHHVNQCLDSSREATSNSSQDEIDDEEEEPPSRVAIEHSIISDTDDDDHSDDDDDDDDDGCPICAQPWRWIDLAPVQGSRDAHVGQCLEQDESMAERSEVDDDDEDLNARHARSSLPRPRKGFGAMKKPRLLDGNDVEPRGTPDLIPLIASIIETGPKRRARLRSTRLADKHTHFISGQVRDLGWGCGYRNAQMLYCSLRHLPEYDTSTNSTSTSTPIPSILELQGVVEDAWKAGHDPLGATHFKGKLRGSKKWIGPTEVYTAFTALRIRCDRHPLTAPIRPTSSNFTFDFPHSSRIVDFPKLPQSKDAITPSLIRWIIAYFTDTLPASHSSNSKSDTQVRASPSSSGSFSLIMTGKQPLFLQHQGHSRTVVGIEYDDEGDGNLLLFDPGRHVPSTLKKAAADLQHTLSSSPSTSKKRPLSSSSTNSTTPSSKAFWAQSPHSRLEPDPADSESLVEPNAFLKMRARASMITTTSSGLGVKSLSLFQVGFQALSRKEEYQILYVEPGPPLSAEEVEERKCVKSSRVIA